VENRIESIARALNDVAVRRVDRIAQQRIVTRKGKLHRAGMVLPQWGTALDIGEQEGDRACGQCRLLARRLH